MKNKKGNCSIILSCIALGISLVTIALFFIKVTPNSIVDGNSFISILAAFIGISVSLLIGYQVYNAVEIKQELLRIDDIKQEMDKTKAGLDAQKQEIKKKWDQLNNKMEISRCISLSRIEAEHNPIMAFIRLHEALQFILLSDDLEETLDWYKEELVERMERIDRSDFGLDVAGGVQKLKNEYNDDIEIIKTCKYYYIVKDWYEELMKRFEKNLDGFVNEASNECLEQYSDESICRCGDN